MYTKDTLFFGQATHLEFILVFLLIRKMWDLYRKRTIKYQKRTGLRDEKISIA